MLETILLRDCKDQGIDLLVDRGLCYTVRSLQQGVIRGLQCLGCENTFIKVDNSICFVFQFLHSALNLLSPVLIFNFFVRVNKLNLLDLLALDLMNSVHLS